MKKVWMDLACIILVAAFMMIFRLGSLPLLDPDEPVYAQTATEMIVSGDFISPRIYGDFWYDKPPMYYWLVAGAMQIFGQTEFAARVPSAFLAIGGALLIYFAGRSLLSRRAGLLAALILTTSLEYFYLGKAAVTDMTLTFFFSAALCGYAKRRYLLMYVCMGLAMLTKGPVGIVLPAAIIFFHLLLTKDWRRIRDMRAILGILIIILVNVPWYGMMYNLHGMDFINTFLGYHNVTRFLQPEHSSGTKLYYYFPVLLIGFFPWIIYLGQALKAAIENRRSAEGNFLLLLMSWICTVFVFFSLSQTKLISYILPMYPPMALLVGWYVDRALALNLVGRFVRGAAALVMIGSLMIGVLVIFSLQQVGYVISGVQSMAAVIGAMILVSVMMCVWKRNMYHVTGLIVGMMCFVAVLMTQIFPVAANFVSVKSVAYAVNQGDLIKNIPVYVDKFYRPGFCYYTGIAGSEIGGNLSALMEEDAQAYFFIKEGQYAALTKEQQDKLLILYKQAAMVFAYKS